MKVRTVTAHLHLHPGRIEEMLDPASEFLHEAKDRLEMLDLEVQTLRVSTQPWPTYQLNGSMEPMIGTVRSIQKASLDRGIDFVSIGPALYPDQILHIPEVVADTTSISTSAIICDPVRGILENNISAAARTVRTLSELAPDGSMAFLFCAAANCPPFTPFFPASYHEGRDNGFTIGLEAGDLVWKAFELAKGLSEAGRALSHLYAQELERVERTARSLDGHGGFLYHGIDPSLAPGLDRSASIAGAIERFLGSPFGTHGTLAVCAALTKALKELPVKKCGYSGLMLPVLEDEGLASAADLGALDLNRLLVYSAVCGTGLDTVPIPGDIPAERIEAILRDVASLSDRLKKPLSARLLPIPGRTAGETTELRSKYVRNCAILGVS